jgi:16S rRNA (guanine966-N2)-methyltransferase
MTAAIFLSPTSHKMRIIGGTAAGILLKAPKGFDVRPTPDLVRQAIFNSLAPRIAGATVLELFAGTGALSLESLSRGAAHAICVENSSRHAQFIRQNLAVTHLPEDLLDLWVNDAYASIAQLAQGKKQFDLIFADPPYGNKNVGRRSTSDAQKLLDDPHLPKLLTAGGLFILGHTKRDTLELPECWQEKKILKHGDSWMRFLRVADFPKGVTRSSPSP